MAHLPDPLNQSGPALEKTSIQDPAGFFVNFSQGPNNLEHLLSYSWDDMRVQIQTRQPGYPDDPVMVRTSVNVTQENSKRITPQNLGERVTELVAGLARNSGSLSGFLDVIATINDPEVATANALANFDRVREGSPDYDDANQVASIDSVLPGCGIIPGEVLWVTSPAEFRVMVAVEQLDHLPEIWKEIAIRLGLTESKLSE